MSVEIVSLHPDFVVVSKPQGLVVHASLDKNRENLFDLLKVKFPTREVSLLHRLDKDTSGLILFSLNSDKNKVFQKLLEERKIQKTYVAKVKGITEWHEEILLKDYLKKEKIKGIEKMSVVQKGGDVALAYAKTLAPHIVQVTLETGRMHQIRVQLASRGHPIIGDSLYGADHGKLHLHSSFLSFDFEGNWCPLRYIVRSKERIFRNYRPS